MTDISVRALSEDEWETYRDVRLRSLQESPEAFAATAATEQSYDEEFWRKRVARSRRMVAEQDGDIVGVVSVGHGQDEDERVCELFGLWVTPELRGGGVAWKLVEAGVQQARKDSFEFVAYWVGTDNGRGVAFASSFGFRPTDGRRPMKSPDPADHQGDDDEPEDEMAMVYPLGDDPGAVPNSLS